MIYSHIIYFLLIIFFFYQLLMKKWNIFHVFIFVLPFHSWSVDIGLKMTVSQVVTMIMILITVLPSTQVKNKLYNFKNKYILFFLSYVILGTVIISIFYIENYLQLGGFLRSDGRFIAQLILLLITFSIIPMAFNYIKKTDDVRKYIKVYLSALIFLLVLGWIQYIIYGASGIDIFPLNIDEFGRFKSGLFSDGGVSIFRMSSLGGEPKSFSLSLVVGFFIIHIFSRNNISFFKYDTLLKYLFLFTAFSTLSTSGIMLFIILFFVDILYTLLKSKNNIKFNYKKILYSCIIISIFGILLFKNWDFISFIFEQRVLNRGDITSEDFDAPIKALFLDSPQYLFFGTGMGNIHNLAAPYISSTNLHYMGNIIFVSKSGYLKLISEIGMLGLLLFFLMNYIVWKRLKIRMSYANFQQKRVILSISLLLLMILIGFMARGYLLNDYILFFAIANALVFSKSKKNNDSSYKMQKKHKDII